MEDIAKDEELALVNRIGNASGYKHVSEQRVSEQQAPLLWKLRPRAPRKKKHQVLRTSGFDYTLVPGTRQAGPGSVRCATRINLDSPRGYQVPSW